jgi:hypothetical protein
VWGWGWNPIPFCQAGQKNMPADITHRSPEHVSVIGMQENGLQQSEPKITGLKG